MPSLKQVFGANLRQLRKLHSWSQADLAEAAGLSLDMIGRMERGEAAPSFDTIETLARVLDVPASSMLGAFPSQGRKNKERAKSLQRVGALLADSSDSELRKIEKVIAAILDREHGYR